MKLKKGSKAAKEFMAKIRRMKGKPKKTKLGAVKRSPAKKGYFIFEGFDHYKNKPLFRVKNNNTDYIGEWHTTKAEANEELRYITKGGKSKVGAVKRSTRKVFKKNSSVLGSIQHNDTKSHNYKINISGADSYMNGVNDYIKKIQKGIAMLEKEISATDKAVKEEKNPLIKKSLINRRTFLRSELKIGKQFLKKHI